MVTSSCGRAAWMSPAIKNTSSIWYLKDHVGNNRVLVDYLPEDYVYGWNC